MAKKKIIMLSILLVLLLVASSFGGTYVFWMARLKKYEALPTLKVTSGTIDIAFVDNNKVNFKGSEVTSKMFTITGNNTSLDDKMYYKLYLIVEKNTFSDKGVYYTLISNNTNSNGEIIPGMTESLNSGSNQYLLGEGFFTAGSNKIHAYIINVNFPAKQNKKFVARLEIESAE